MSKKLIKGATILTMTKKEIIPKGDILIEGSKIMKIAPEIEAADAEIISGEHMIACPGFVDAHRHNWQSLIKMVCVDWTMGGYVSGIKWTLGDSFSVDELYFSEYLGALELLNAGTTTMCNFAHNTISPEHTDAMAQAMADAKIRCVFGYGGTNAMWKEMPSITPYDYEDAKRVFKKYYDGSNPLLSMAVGARGPQNVPEQMAIDEIMLGKELDIPVLLSIGEGLWCAAFPNTVEWMYEKGLLDDKCQFTHMNASSKDAFKMMAEKGSAMVMCPEVELAMGFGWNSTLNCIEAGITPGISTDTPPSVNSDLFSQMRTTLITVRNQLHLEELRERKLSAYNAVNAYDVLRYATVGGAKGVMMEDKIGTLEEGKEADIILVNTDRINMIPMNGAINTIVEYANAGDVDTVLVGGNVVKRDGALVGINLAELRAKAESLRDAYFAKCNAPYDGLWQPEPYIPDFEI